jgi:hypothetical protein
LSELFNQSGSLLNRLLEKLVHLNRISQVVSVSRNGAVDPNHEGINHV